MLCTQAYSQSEWKIEKESQGIVVQTRITDLSPIKEFRASTTVGAPLAMLVAELNAVEEHPQWMADITYGERLQEMPEVLHYNVKTPFPLKDKYIVVDVSQQGDDSGHKIEMTTSEMAPNAIDGHERIPVVEGYWEFQKLDDSTTRVTYQFLSDPGLKMPDWLVNMFIVNGPYKTLKDLKKRLE